MTAFWGRSIARTQNKVVKRGRGLKRGGDIGLRFCVFRNRPQRGLFIITPVVPAIIPKITLRNLIHTFSTRAAPSDFAIHADDADCLAR